MNPAVKDKMHMPADELERQGPTGASARGEPESLDAMLKHQWLSLKTILKSAERQTPDPRMLEKLRLLEQAMDYAEQILDAREILGLNSPPPPTSQQGKPRILSFLSTTALLGIEIDAFESVGSILAIAQRLRSDLPQFRLMQTLLYARAADPLDTRRQLFQMVQDFPHFELGVAMLALIDKQVNFAGWKGLAQTLVTESSDAGVRQLAQFVLDVDEFDAAFPALMAAVSQSTASM
jgi:Bacterial type III secretion protein (HrpB1_HrpK)